MTTLFCQERASSGMYSTQEHYHFQSWVLQEWLVIYKLDARGQRPWCITKELTSGMRSILVAVTEIPHKGDTGISRCWEVGLGNAIFFRTAVPYASWGCLLRRAAHRHESPLFCFHMHPRMADTSSVPRASWDLLNPFDVFKLIFVMKTLYHQTGYSHTIANAHTKPCLLAITTYLQKGLRNTSIWLNGAVLWTTVQLAALVHRLSRLGTWLHFSVSSSLNIHRWGLESEQILKVPQLSFIQGY